VPATVSVITAVTAPVITAAVVTAVDRCGHDDKGWRRPIGITGTRNGNGDASGGGDGN
jgi:hypothetical protein